MLATPGLEELEVLDAGELDAAVVPQGVRVAAAVVHELADLRVLEEPGEAGGRDRASEQAALDDLSGTRIAPAGGEGWGRSIPHSPKL